MSWRLLTREEIKREFPRAPNIVSAAGLTNDEGALYADAVITFHGDGYVTLPPIELTLSELKTLLETLQQAAVVTLADASVAEHAERP